MLVLSRKLGEKINVGENLVLTVVGVSSDGRVRLSMLPETTSAGNRFLVTGPPAKSPDDGISVSPESCLFLVFADTELTEEGILDFANRYGCLGRPERVTLADPHGQKRVQGESFDELWRPQILAMRKLTSLWLALAEEDASRLGQFIVWETAGGGPIVYFAFDLNADGPRSSSAECKVQRDVITSAEVRPELLRGFKAGDLLEPAQRYLEEKVNEHLKKFTSGEPRLIWTREGGFGFHFASEGLLSAIWVSFAEAIASKEIFRRCGVCQTWFEIAPGVARTHRRYCSERCRVKGHRGRQDKARQLHTQKKSFKEIAEELDADVAKVKRWITGFKE